MFNENADVDRVLNISKEAMLFDFLKQSDDGVEREVLEDGNNLSGGQKARLTIARALYKDSEILIFDDSFKALDFKTDRKIRKNLKDNFKSRTIFMISQRIGTIKDADMIIVLENGKIVGKGKHDELLKNNTVYREIALSQLSKEEIYG